MSADLDVLIVNYLTPDLVAASVDRLAGPGVNLLVWDNSADLDPGRVAAASVAEVGENLFYAEASNRLFAESNADLVLLLNPDVVLDRDQLEVLLAALRADAGAWGVAPRLVSEDGSDQSYLRRLPTLASVAVDRWPWLRPVLGRAGDRYWCADLPRERDGVVGQPAAACLLLRREAVGPQLFDPRFRLFFNDTELALRLNRRGYCRYLGSMSVVHFGGVSIRRAADRPAMRREYDRSYFRYCRSFVRGWPLLAPIFWSRALADAVLKVLRACFD